jgi:hypothetical protein
MYMFRKKKRALSIVTEKEQRWHYRGSYDSCTSVFLRVASRKVPRLWLGLLAVARPVSARSDLIGIVCLGLLHR